MQNELHVHFHFDGLTINVVHSADPALTSLIQSIKQEIRNMSSNVQAGLDKLAADVAQLTTVDQSAVALIQGFGAQLAAAVAAAQAAGATPEQLQAFDDLSAGIEARTSDLAAAVAAATPAAPAAPAA